MSSRLRDLLKKFALLTIALLTALLLAELAVRIVFPRWAPRTGRLVELWQYDRDYGWAHVPGSSGRFASFGFDTFVEINSLGYRGPEPLERKDPLQRRIVVVGDSFVWGFGVEYDEIFSSRIGAHCPGAEVINLGVSGYSTDQELLLYEDVGAGFEPDIVVLVVAANDFKGNTHSKEYVYYYKPLFVVEGGELVLKNRPVPRANPVVRVAASVSKRSYLLTQLNRVIHGLRYGVKKDVPATRQPASAGEGDGEFPRTPAERVTGRLLQRFISAVEADGATPVVVFADGMNGRDRWLARYLAGTGAELLHIDDHLSSVDYDDHHLTDDFHWNPKGHAVVGDAMLETMISSGVLSGDACSGWQSSGSDLASRTPVGIE